MSGKGLQSLLKKVSDLLQLPVLLLDQHAKMQAEGGLTPF